MVKQSTGARLLVNGALIVSAIYFLLPLVWVAMASGKTTSELYTTFGLWFGSDPAFIENIANVVTADDGVYGVWMLNSVVYSAGGALGATVLAVACGYGLAKYAFRGREFLFSVVLGGVLVPATIIALPLYFLLNPVGITGTAWSVLLPSMVSPFGVYLARIHANAAIPDEIIEAARIDGAGDLRVFGAIGLRLMAPAALTIFLFQFVAVWNNFLLPLVMLSDVRKLPVTLGLQLWNSQTQRDPVFTQLVITGSALSALALVALMIAVQRYWRTDLSAGATKG